MKFPSPEGVVSVRAKHRIAQFSSAASFETYWEFPDTELMASPTRMLAITNAIDNKMRAPCIEMMSSNVWWNSTECYFYNGGSQHDYTSTAAPALGEAGAGITSQLPSDVALIIQKRTGQSGRRNRGRLFIPGIEESWSNGGQLNTAGGLLAEAIAVQVGSNVTSGVDIGGARHWRREKWTTALPPVLVHSTDLIPITDARWVDILGTRRDRAPYRWSTAH